jgi:amino acid transporter
MAALANHEGSIIIALNRNPEESSMSTQLKAGSLSLIESLVMGVAGSAPAFTIAVTTAALLGTVGTLSPGALVIFAVPMLGIAVAYKALNKRSVHAGAAYQWTSEAFGRLFGYFSGWALLVASLVFMVTGSLPIATSTLDFINPNLAGNVALTAGVATVWFLIIATVLIKGIEITSKVQLILSTIELVILAIVLIAALVHGDTAGLANPFSWSWFGFGYTPASFAAAALVAIFFYWGWDVTANLSEETRNPEETAGNGGFSSVLITIVFYVGFTLAALVSAIGVQVAYYYGLAGLAAAWTFRAVYKESVARWIGIAVFPLLSALFLIGLGLYAITTFSLITKIVGIGGLLLGALFFRPSRYVAPAPVLGAMRD